MHIQIMQSWQMTDLVANYSYLQNPQQPHRDRLQSESLPVTNTKHTEVTTLG